MGRDAVEVNKEPERRERSNITDSKRAQEEWEEGKLQKHHHAAISEAWVAMATQDYVLAWCTFP